MTVPDQHLLTQAIEKFPQQALSPKKFNHIALETFTRQRRTNPTYSHFCKLTLRRDPKHWREIPFLPVSAYKYQRVTAFKGKAQGMFCSSGTTQKVRSRHYYRSLEMYKRTIERMMKTFVMRGKSYGLASLVPDWREAPASSLAFMVSHVSSSFPFKARYQAIRQGQVHFAGLKNFLTHQSKLNRPVLLLATSFALATFCENLAEHNNALRLPRGSRIMDTGGYKGRSRQLNRRDLLKIIQKCLGVPASRVINEYGMTELTSQFYNGQSGSWLRAEVVHPDTLKPLSKGQMGMIRIADLANQESCAFIQTEDLGRFSKGRLQVVGRLPGSGLKGCSLGFEELTS